MEAIFYVGWMIGTLLFRIHSLKLVLDHQWMGKIGRQL